MSSVPPVVVWRRPLPLGLWLSGFLVASLMTLHGLALMPLARQTLTLSAVTPFQGFAYLAQLPPRAYPEPVEPAEDVSENGRPLPFPHLVGWQQVASAGGGRYHISGNMLFFSTTDNSDPRVNGRTYAVTRPMPIPKRLVQGLWILLVLGLLVVDRSPGPAMLRVLAKPPFWVPATLFFIIVAANRAWFFIDFPIPAVHPDSGSYFAVAEEIGNGIWPKFGTRPPVYPLFLKAVLSTSKTVMAVAIWQTLFSILASLSLVYAVYRWLPAVALPAAVVAALFLCGLTTMEHDTAMLSESLYASFLVAGFGTLLVGIRAGSARWLAVASAGMALAILTRPAGIFLEVSYVIIAAWLLYNHFPRRAVVAFIIPFPLLLLMVCTYNWRVVGVFATTTWGEVNFAGATLLTWQTDPAYPPEINKAIVQIQDVIQKRFIATKKDPGVLERSWDPDELAPVFLDGFNWGALAIVVNMGGDYDTMARTWIRRVAFDAVKKRPIIYVKFVYTMMVYYFQPTIMYDFRSYLQNRAWVYWVARDFAPEKKNPFMIRLGMELADSVPPKTVIITDFDPARAVDLQDRVLVRATRGWRFYDLTRRARAPIYDSWFWPAGLLVSLIGSVYLLVRSRFRHHGAFAVFIVSVSALGASLVVSLVEYSQPRYSYPMEWAYGLSVLLLPLLFMRSNAIGPASQ